MLPCKPKSIPRNVVFGDEKAQEINKCLKSKKV